MPAAYIVMAYVIMAYIVMAYTVMAYVQGRTDGYGDLYCNQCWARYVPPCKEAGKAR